MAHSITSRCDGCSACFRQCPVQAIYQVSDTRYAIDADRCIDCDVCGMVCPVEAVLDGQGRQLRHIPRDQRLRPVADPDLCNGCGTCVDVCPFDCLAVVGRRHFGVAYLAYPEACVSCAECVHHCIKGAIAMRPLDIRAFEPAEEIGRLASYLTAAV